MYRFYVSKITVTLYLDVLGEFVSDRRFNEFDYLVVLMLLLMLNLLNQEIKAVFDTFLADKDCVCLIFHVIHKYFLGWLVCSTSFLSKQILYQ